MSVFGSDFTGMIDQFSVEFTLETVAEGEYVLGSYKPGAAEFRKMRGVVAPYAQSKVYQSGGVLTHQSRRLIVSAPLGGDIRGLHVLYGGQRYSVEEETDHTAYGDAAVYRLNWEEALDKPNGT